MPSKAIVVGIDFSGGGDAALDAAIALARDLRARLVLVHAFERAFVAAEPVPSAIGMPQLEAELEEGDAIEVTQRAEKARAQGLEVKTETAMGPPATVITDAGKTHDASLIVVGTTGRTGLQRLLLGSVAENVVRHAGRPVLVVPHSHK